MLLPPGILGTAAGANSSQPVNIVFFASAVNLHALSFADNASDVNMSGPLISYSLTQSGLPLGIRGAANPISISMPLSSDAILRSNGTGQTCVGTGTASSGCTSVLSCRFWNASLQQWSSEGCRTIAQTEGPAAGSVTCECDHLTEFVVFEFPTSADALLADLLAGGPSCPIRAPYVCPTSTLPAAFASLTTLHNQPPRLSPPRLSPPRLSRARLSPPSALPPHRFRNQPPLVG